MPALAPGVTLEYEVVKRLINPLAPGEFWYQHSFLANAIVLDERLELAMFPPGEKSKSNLRRTLPRKKRTKASARFTAGSTPT